MIPLCAIMYSRFIRNCVFRIMKFNLEKGEKIGLMVAEWPCIFFVSSPLVSSSYMDKSKTQKLSFWLQVFLSSKYGLEMVLCLVMYVTFMFLIERYKKHQMIWTTNECSFVLWYLWFVNVKLHASLHINDISNTFTIEIIIRSGLCIIIILLYNKPKFQIKIQNTTSDDFEFAHRK